MLCRWLALILLFSSPAVAGIVDDVLGALAQNQFSVADSELRSYRALHGADAQYLEALSWMARGALSARQYNQAYSNAKQVQSLATPLLKQRALDAEPHLPIALGAAYEIEAQVLAGRGDRTQAVTLLQSALATYGQTSIRARLQKNLNLLSLVGKPAPPLQAAEYLGPRPATLSQLHGSPVLLFFWAHWCVDCKGEAPIITRLKSEYASRGLVVIGPTQLYGYAAQGQDATPKTEVNYIDSVRQRYYSGLLDMPVPISKHNFDTYGASTTPTLVLVDRSGHVAMYHPGAMPYEDLRSEIDKVVAR